MTLAARRPGRGAPPGGLRGGVARLPRGARLRPRPRAEAAEHGGAGQPHLGSCHFFGAKLWQNFARFRLYRHRSLQENTRFAVFFKIYQII